jgi:hypothetical protein
MAELKIRSRVQTEREKSIVLIPRDIGAAHAAV